MPASMSFSVLTRLEYRHRRRSHFRSPLLPAESMLVEQSVGANDLSPVVEPEETIQSVITG